MIVREGAEELRDGGQLGCLPRSDTDRVQRVWKHHELCDLVQAVVRKVFEAHKVVVFYCCIWQSNESEKSGFRLPL